MAEHICFELKRAPPALFELLHAAHGLVGDHVLVLVPVHAHLADFDLGPAAVFAALDSF